MSSLLRRVSLGERCFIADDVFKKMLGLAIAAVAAIAMGCSTTVATAPPTTAPPTTAAPTTAPPTTAPPTTEAPVAPAAFDASYLSLGPGRAFPALDDPPMVAASEADWLEDNDIVLGIVEAGEAHAFPAGQLAYHHIVNTTVAGEPYLVTY